MARPHLLVISQERIQQELRRAAAAAADTRYDIVRHRWLLAACVVELFAGLTLMVLGYHVSGADFGEALFLGGLLIGYLGPAWTWILANWHGNE